MALLQTCSSLLASAVRPIPVSILHIILKDSLLVTPACIKLLKAFFR